MVLHDWQGAAVVQDAGTAGTPEAARSEPGGAGACEGSIDPGESPHDGGGNAAAASRQGNACDDWGHGGCSFASRAGAASVWTSTGAWLRFAHEPRSAAGKRNTTGESAGAGEQYATTGRLAVGAAFRGSPSGTVPQCTALHTASTTAKRAAFGSGSFGRRKAVVWRRRRPPSNLGSGSQSLFSASCAVSAKKPKIIGRDQTEEAASTVEAASSFFS